MLDVRDLPVDQVANAADAGALATWCLDKLGLAFHPDTDFAEYVDDRGDATFSSGDSQRLNTLIHQAFDVCGDFHALCEACLQHWRFADPGFLRAILNSADRDDIIRWLVWNDPNGVYTDEDSDAEGMAPLPLERARELMAKALAD